MLMKAARVTNRTVVQERTIQFVDLALLKFQGDALTKHWTPGLVNDVQAD